MNIVDKAREFALKAHGDQNHGSLKIADHLKAVTDKIDSEFSAYKDMTSAYNILALDELLAIGWLHDVLEDTDVAYATLSETFGPNIAYSVYRLTDKEGKNRKERHLNTYYLIRSDWMATFVKLADRWHNQQRSIDNGERFVKMYHREYEYFKFALWSPAYWTDNFWKQLDAQYEKMDDIVNGFALDRSELVA